MQPMSVHMSGPVSGGAESERPSVAIVVDDLATWLVAGHQPTGIQRVSSPAAEASYARDDIRSSPVITVGSPNSPHGTHLQPMTRQSLRWEAHGHRGSPQLRLLPVGAATCLRARPPEPCAAPNEGRL